MDRLSLGSPLLPTVPFVLEIELDGPAIGTPTFTLFVNGVVDGTANVIGTQVSGNLWLFTITPSSGATIGGSARIRIDYELVAGSNWADFYSWIAQTANLIETDGVYKYRQNAIDETAKTADVTVTKV